MLRCILIVSWSKIFLFLFAFNLATPASADTVGVPTPLVTQGQPADWVFVFKLNAAVFPSDATDSKRNCLFGGTPQPYRAFSQHYVSASSVDPTLHEGQGAIGASRADPLGATFAEIYNSNFYYVVWNDQFYRHPAIAGCSDSCGGPWGHSKGVIAWNDAGDGIVLQVTTPSWPAAGSARNVSTIVRQPERYIRLGYERFGLAD